MPSLPAVREPPFSLPAHLSARVLLALEAAFHVHDAEIRKLRSVIEECVAELQGQGMLAEAVVITMRAFVNHMVAHPTAEHPMASRAAHLLLDRIIYWSILAYYPTSTPPA